MGSRTANNEKAAKWVSENGAKASQGSFEDAASFGDILFNCTSGTASLEALKMAGAKNINSKILVDVSNPRDFSKGMPPTLSVCNDGSLGEQIQRAYPEAKVVKTLNTMNCRLMVNPSMINGNHDIFISGNHEGAKNEVKTLLTNGFGWKRVIDLGDITTARGTEQLLPLWVRLMGTLKTPQFNFSVVQ
jgi:predicted dinucleotide-binding enzyme